MYVDWWKITFYSLGELVLVDPQLILGGSPKEKPGSLSKKISVRNRVFYKIWDSQLSTGGGLNKLVC